MNKLILCLILLLSISLVSADQTFFTNISGDVNATFDNFFGNIDGSTANFSTLQVENITITDTTTFSGNVTADTFFGDFIGNFFGSFFGVYNWTTISNLLSFDGSSLDLNETLLNETINNSIDLRSSILNVNSSDFWDNRNSPVDINGSEIINDLNWINSTFGNSTYILQSSEVDLNVNSSDFWDGLDVPTDLNNKLTLDWENITNKFIETVDNIYLFMSGTNLTLNETKLNETINSSIDLRAVTTEVDPLWSGNQSNYLNLTQLNDTYLKLDASNDPITGNLSINARLNVTERSFLNKGIVIGTPCSILGQIDDEDSCSSGGMIFNATVATFARPLGASLIAGLDSTQSVTETHVNLTATWNVTTNLFCDSEDPFSSDDLFNQLNFLFSVPVNYLGLVSEITEFINSTCVRINPLGIANETLVDVSLVAYAVGSPSTFGIFNSGAAIFNIGPHDSKVFKVNSKTARGRDNIVFDSVITEDNTNIINILSDANGQKSTQNFLSFMETSQAISSPTMVNMMLEADLSNMSNGTYNALDINLVNEGTNMETTGLRISSLFDNIIQIGQEESASRAYYDDNTTTTDITNDINDSSTLTTLFENNGSIFYFGNIKNFTEITVSISTEASESIEPIFFYCNGSNEWEQFNVSDGTFGFTKAGTIKLNNPINRGECNIELDGTPLADTINYTYIAIQRTANIVNTNPVVKTVRMFIDSSRIVIGNVNGITGAENAFGLSNDELQEEGGISFYIKAKNLEDNDIVNTWFQVGGFTNGSASGVRNSYLIISDRNATENQKSNLTFLSCAIDRVEQMGITSKQAFDSTNFGADLFVEWSIGTQKQFIYNDNGNGLLRVEGDANFFMSGNDLDIFNGSLHLVTPRIELVGFENGSQVTVINENFEDGSISPFVQITSGGGTSEWTAISDANCHDEICARAIGASLSPPRIMQTNFSTVDLNNLNITFFITTIGLSGSDLVNVTINNNSGSGDVELFSTNAVLSDVQQNASIPSSMDNQSVISLNFFFSANVLNEEVYIDDILILSTATADTQQNITVGDAEIKMGSSTDGITYTGDEATGTSILNITADQINLIGNVTQESITQQDLNVTTSITLDGELITNWDNVSSFDDNVFLHDGSRNMTGNIVLNNKNITFTDCIIFSSGGQICSS